RVAPSEANVLVTGEHGTGKELVARILHSSSARAQRALVTVNVGGLAEGVFESELFGHEKGAFTGAVARRAGRFELADGGTLFLDECGDLSPEVQVKLLRVLQEREFERVGGSDTIRVDVRVISATHRDFEHEIVAAIERNQGNIAGAARALGINRSTLYYRLRKHGLEHLLPTKPEPDSPV